MYKVLLLFLLLTATNAEAKTDYDFTFNDASKITSQQLLYCRYIRDDMNSSNVSIPEINFYYELQFKLEKNKQKVFYDSFFNACEPFYSKDYKLFMEKQKKRS